MKEKENVQESVGILEAPAVEPTFLTPTQTQVSGLYTWRRPFFLSSPIPQATDAPMAQEETSETWGSVLSEELRLDVDGRYPQMVASGVVHAGITGRAHWIASLTSTEPNRWEGSIFYKEGSLAVFPYTKVKIKAIGGSIHPTLRKAIVTFENGAWRKIRIFKLRSEYYHPVDLEFDYVEGEDVLLQIDTSAHPNRPSTLPAEELTIPTVFERSGFHATTSPGDKLPITGAGPNALWSDQEMHDAMQVYWSHFASASQWAMWIFFASLHEWGTGLGGIMFDDIGPNHRQGTAVFNDSFIKTPPPSDPNADAWTKRMNFWTTCHEMGHCFNLAHSWQKSLGTAWIPLVNEPEARSFMNYPYNVSGGQAAFFSDFEFRFSDGELLFMRHAPERFVQMGNADWFDNHGFREANFSLEPRFSLELNVNRDKPSFEFMEPVVLELKLTNISDEPQLVQENLLRALERMTIVIKKQSKPARQFTPFAQYCWQPKNTVLEPGKSVYDSLFAAVGRNGWEISDPGYYEVQAALHLNNEDLVSNKLKIRVLPPIKYEEEYLAQDFFTEEVGRILNFDGSRYLKEGNDTLREVANKLGDRKVAIHANIALANAAARDYKMLEIEEGISEIGQAAQAGKIRIKSADEKESRKQFESAFNEPEKAAETLGHIDYKEYADRFSKAVADQGDHSEATQIQKGLYDTLESLGVSEEILSKPNVEVQESKERERVGQTTQKPGQDKQRPKRKE